MAEIGRSDVFNWECELESVKTILSDFSKRLAALESEAQDLVELQDLLDTNIVDFKVLPK